MLWVPHSLLLFEKEGYIGSLTSVFVNRNTAGTFLGVSSLVLFTLLLAVLKMTRGSKPIVRLLQDEAIPRERKVQVALLCVLMGVVLLALFLTRSRGALIATVIAYLAVMPFVVADLLKSSNAPSSLRQEPAEGARAWRRPAAVLGAAAVIILIAILFGGQSIARMEREGADLSRLCVYAGTLRAFLENWLFGTGFGTFQSVFPAYREIGCAGPGVSFLRAHDFFLEGLLGFGILFVPALLFGYGHLIRGLWSGTRSRRRLRHVPLLALGALLLVTLHGLVDFSLQIPGMAAFFAAYLAAAMTISLGRQKKRPAPVAAVSSVRHPHDLSCPRKARTMGRQSRPRQQSQENREMMD